MAEPRRVSFDSPGTASPRLKPVPTQKYNRKQIQRILDLEEWIDTQMHVLFECKDGSDPPVELYLDNIFEQSENDYESYIRSTLVESNASFDIFVTELLSRIKELPKKRRR
eukprot:m.310153 g.310153  ORF g.310153 m.310153 type:complete len:111 (+) comp49856_c0_seq1:3-335(+)